MFIGACRIAFALPGNRSLKGKRQVQRRICDKLRHKFHVAAAEVGDPELWSEVEIGFTLLSGNEAHVRAMLENIIDFIDGMMIAPMNDLELEVISFDDISTGETYSRAERWSDEAEAKIGDLAEEGGERRARPKIRTGR
jgi:uncharacterized protein